MAAEAETLRKVLDGKMAFLTTVINACMLWWASSVVFCGSVLSGAYIKRNELKRLPWFDWFAGIVAFFFLSIVTFGLGMGIWMQQVRAETAQLGSLLHLKLTGDLYGTEFSIFQWGIWLGTSSFVLVLITWLGIWYQFRGSRKLH